MKQKEKKTKEKRLTLEQRLELLPKFENKSLTQEERELEVCAGQIFSFMIEKLGIKHRATSHYEVSLRSVVAFNGLTFTRKNRYGFFISYNVWEKHRYNLYKNSCKNYFKLLDKYSYFSLLDNFFINHLKEFCNMQQNKIGRYNELIKIMQSPVNIKEPLYFFSRVTKINAKVSNIKMFLKRHYNINFSLIYRNIPYENYIFQQIKFINTNCSLTNEKHLRAFAEFLHLREEVYHNRSFKRGELSTYCKVAQSNIFDFLQDKEAYDKKYNVLYVKGKKYRKTTSMGEWSV